MRFPAALVIALAALAIAPLVACGDESGADRVAVHIGELEVQAEVVDTVEARALGLGGRDSLARDQGMLFVFPQTGRHGFWMKGMRFPLDFVWISDGLRVVDLLEDTPAPAAGTPDSSLQLYRPAQDVRYVLEINAGLIADAGVQVGDQVDIEGGAPVTSQ